MGAESNCAMCCLREGTAISAKEHRMARVIRNPMKSQIPGAVVYVPHQAADDV